jgi:hypothetical protein
MHYYWRLKSINWYNTQRLYPSLGYPSSLEMKIQLRGIIKKVA